MTITRVTQGIIPDTYLLNWIGVFLVDRKVQNLSKGTLKFYQEKLKLFTDFCEAQVVSDINEITPSFIRQFLFYLEEQGHNPGGIHACYRSLKAFLRWYENEAEPENWKNPINKVKAPKVSIEPLEPVEFGDITALLDTCKKGTFTGDRDKAIFLCLLDTGVRAQELLDIDLADIDLITGVILIRKGKGRKPRTVYLGATSRKAVRTYLKHRTDNLTPLWIQDDLSGRLGYFGLRAIVIRRAKLAGIKPPSLHSFRRQFALSMLRAGVNIYSLQELMGHADLQVLKRYLKLVDTDLRQAHSIGSPVENWQK